MFVVCSVRVLVHVNVCECVCLVVGSPAWTIRTYCNLFLEPETAAGLTLCDAESCTDSEAKKMRHGLARIAA